MLRLDRSSFDTASSRLRAQPQQLSAVTSPTARAVDPVAAVKHLINERLGSVLRGVPGKLQQAEYSTQFFTRAQQEMIRNAPEDMLMLLIQRFQQDNFGRMQGMRSLAAAVERPFSAAETGASLQKAALGLRGSVEQSLAVIESQARSNPDFERLGLAEMLASTRERVFKEIDASIAKMTRPGATLEEIKSAQPAIDMALSVIKATGERVLAGLPGQMQYKAKAEQQLTQESLNLANYTLFSRARQPSGPNDFSKLEGQLPPMTGPLTPQQAMQTLGALESRIKTEYEVRRQKAMNLPPELLEAAMFDAAAQRDRLLVAAYRNVVSRLVDPQSPPPPPAG
jgi:hypothetical protein